MNLNKHAIAITWFCAGLTATSAFADSPDNVLTKTLPVRDAGMPDVSVTMGAGVVNTTRYLGSDERRYRIMPTFNAIWKNGWFAGFPRGVGYNFSADPRISYGLRMTADHGRRQNASAALTGLGDIGARPELGGFLNYSLGRSVKLNTAVRYGAGVDSQGTLLDLGVNYRTPLDENQSVTFGIATTYANSNYMQSYFGVNAAQSAASNYALYTPGAGIRETDLSGNYTYKIDQNWAVVTGVTLGRLGSVVRAAPMTRSSSHDSAYVTTNYTF